jgi:hypothetical protein
VDFNKKRLFGLIEYQMWSLATLIILASLNKSEKCKGDFHIFIGDSKFESPVFWSVKNLNIIPNSEV